jgi:hypothetical protein
MRPLYGAGFQTTPGFQENDLCTIGELSRPAAGGTLLEMPELPAAALLLAPVGTGSQKRKRAPRLPVRSLQPLCVGGGACGQEDLASRTASRSVCAAFIFQFVGELAPSLRHGQQPRAIPICRGALRQTNALSSVGAIFLGPRQIPHPLLLFSGNVTGALAFRPHKTVGW